MTRIVARFSQNESAKLLLSTFLTDGDLEALVTWSPVGSTFSFVSLSSGISLLVKHEAERKNKGANNEET
jgi:hypothetical protein